jgi:putative two-component system response regulator
METIFVIDDSDTNLTTAESALEDIYAIMTMPSAAKMFTMLKKMLPDLILLDIEMPEMNGFEALKLIKENETWAEIPVIFLTSRDDSDTEAHGFELGAVDFISKPFSKPVLLNRIRKHLEINQFIRERTGQIRRLQDGIVTVFADIVDNRDKETGGHILRTTLYIKILLNAMKLKGIYLDEILEWDFEKVISSVRLHDIGKVVVSDSILNKSAKLSEEEFEMMKTHAANGERIIDQIIEQSGEGEFLHHAKLFAGYHHERWDCSGYPHGLGGTNIPLHGRIMAIVDVYDALVSSRPYKGAFSHNKAVEIIMSGSGTHFDPNIAQVFFENKKLFEETALCLQDN